MDGVSNQAVWLFVLFNTAFAVMSFRAFAFFTKMKKVEDARRPSAPTTGMMREFANDFYEYKKNIEEEYSRMEER